MARGIEIKANSVKFQLKLPVGTELGNKIKLYSEIFETLLKIKRITNCFESISKYRNCYIRKKGHDDKISVSVQ